MMIIQAAKKTVNKTNRIDCYQQFYKEHFFSKSKNDQNYKKKIIANLKLSINRINFSDIREEV